MSFAGVFDRIVVINLPRRADRLERFQGRLKANWPFAPPSRFDAVDGATLAPPSTWHHGVGAWGCLQSHRAVLEQALADRVRSLLILEDDAVPVEGFAERARSFLSAAPADWACLMFGAEHVFPPTAVAPGVVRCAGAIRAHAYAVRNPMMRMLATLLKRDPRNHCDMILCTLMPHYPTYAADPPLIGQDAGLSDITSNDESLRFFDGPAKTHET